jgi:hypothetical protein
MDYYSLRKKMSYQATKRHNRNLNAYYLVKETNVKEPTILDGSNDMTFWERQNYGDRVKSLVDARVFEAREE